MGSKIKTYSKITVLLFVVAAGIVFGYSFIAPPSSIPSPTTPPNSPEVSRPSIEQEQQKAEDTAVTTSASASTAASDLPQQQADTTIVASTPSQPDETPERAKESITAKDDAKPTEVTLEHDGTLERHPNRTYHALYTPNDYHNQWHTNRISAPAVWDKTTGAADTTIAVIDTGFALEHDELFNRWAQNEGDSTNNTSDDDNNGYIDDWRGWDFFHNDNDPRAGTQNLSSTRVGHGTSVAGLIGAAGNNSLGTVGVNWHTQLLPLQVLNDDGVGYTSDVTAAIDYAIEREVDIINLSLGGEEPDPVLEAAINRAISADILVVAASGNDGCNCMLYPANYPQVLSVGASTSSDSIASFSSYGENLDFIAPGAFVSASPTWRNSNRQSAYATNISGTSFATPIVSGAAALLKSANPSLNQEDIASLLTTHADVSSAMTSSGQPLTYGAGRLNIAASLNATAPNLPTIQPPAYTPLYQLTKAGKHTEHTTLQDRKSKRVLQGYNYEILRFTNTGQ